MSVRILTGDCRDILPTLLAASVQTVVASPPYYGLRDYGIDGQIGLEASLAAFVAEMVAVFRLVRRVLRDDGTLWLNLGDSYAGSSGAQSRGHETPGSLQGGSMLSARQIASHPKGQSRTGAIRDAGLKPKDLMMVPARVALALQADGWWLRSEIVWAKPNPMPESVTDRPTCAHEKIYPLSKSGRYVYDADAVKTQAKWPGGSNARDKIASPHGQGFTR